MKNLASRIRQMREQLRLKQEYVADQLDVSIKTYRRLESKDSDAASYLNIQRLLILAEVLKVSYWVLLGNDLVEQTQMAGSSEPDHQVVAALKKEIAHLQERLREVRQDRGRLIGVVEQLTKADEHSAKS